MKRDAMHAAPLLACRWIRAALRRLLGGLAEPAVWIMIIGVTAVCAGLAYVSYAHTWQTFHDHLREQAQQTRAEFSSALEWTVRDLQQAADLVLTDPDTRALFVDCCAAVAAEGGGPGGARSAARRTELLSRVMPVWENLRQRYGGQQLHFHMGPGATSVLRAHAPGRFGDDLSGVRRMIVDTIRHGRRHGGYELGRVQGGVRGAVPIHVRETGEALGALEIGTSLGYVVRRLRDELGVEFAVLIDLDAADAAMWPDFRETYGATRETRHGFAVEAASTGDVFAILDQADGGKLVSSDEVRLLRLGDRSLACTSFPLHDYAGAGDDRRRAVGRVITWTNEDVALAAVHARTGRLLRHFGFALGGALLALLTGRQIAERHLRATIEARTADVRESRNLLATVLDALPSPVYFKDAAGRYQGCNRAFSDWIGVPTSEIIGRNVHDIYTPEHAARYAQTDEQLLARGGRQTFEYKLPRGDGRTRNVLFHKAAHTDATGQVAGLVGVVVDITERIESERAVLYSQRFLQAALDAITSHLAILDVDGTVLATNAAWGGYVASCDGLDVLGAIGGNYLQALRLGLDPRVTDARAAADGAALVCRGEQESYYLDCAAAEQDGQAEYQVRVVRFEQEGHGRLLVTFEDVTELKRAERSLRDRAAAEHVLNHIAAQLVNLQPDQIDAAIQDALQRLGQAIRAEHCLLFEHHDGRISGVHEWSERGDTPHVDRIDTLDASMFPWMIAQLDAHRTVRIDDVSALPPAAAPEQRVWQTAGVHAVLAVPVEFAGSSRGILGCGRTHAGDPWSPEHCALLRTAGDIIISAVMRSRAEEALRQFRAALDTSPDAVYLVERTSLRLMDVTNAACESLGYARDELLRCDLCDIMPELSPEELYEDADGPGNTRTLVGVLKTQQQRKNGTRFPVEVRLRAHRANEQELIIAVARDVTEQEHTAEMLAQKQVLLRCVMDSIPDLIFYKNADSVYLGCNAAFAEFIGRHEDELVGLTDFDLVPERMARLFRAMDKRMLRQGRARHNEEWVVYPDGRRVLLDTLKTPYMNPRGESLGVIGISRNITARKRAEEEVAEAKELAEAANRTKSEFLANISHEIRTPMTAIMGFADLLRGELPRTTQQEYVDIIRRNGEALLALINDILDLSKIEAGRLEVEKRDCAIAPIVDEVVRLMNVRAIEKGLRLNVVLAPDLPACIHSDPQRLRQILVNLVGNAIKFTPRGTIAICGQRAASAPDSRVEFTVSDEGIGMNREQMARLFRPFTQADASTSRRYGGTGLGLTISQRLAHLLGGEIAVVSQPDVGSTFTLVIDAGDTGNATTLHDADAHVTEDATAASALPTLPPSLSGHVLVADDEPVNQLLLREILTQAGLTVDVADNGQIACERVERANPPYDLIIMDMQMPEMDGYTATQTLRAAGVTTPIIALTAHAMTGSREKCLAAGCDDFAVKPLETERLFTVLAHYLAVDTHATPTVGNDVAL